MTKMIILAIALAFFAGTLVTGTMTLAQGPPHDDFPNPNTDTDGDGVPDVEDSDDDNDGLTDIYEREVSGTNPTRADTDGDGKSDSEELMGEGIGTEGQAPVGTTDPNNDDTDGDGFTDSYEMDNGSDPNDERRTPFAPCGA